MVASGDLRAFTRVDTEIRVELVMAGGKTVSGVLRDVSMSGIFVTGVTDAPVGALCRVSLLLGGGGPRIAIRADGRVLRVDAHGAAIAFAKVDVDSLEHLRNLVLYNAPSSEVVERELASSVGIRPRKTRS